MLEAALAIIAVIVVLAIASRGRRLRERENAGPTFGDLLNRTDVLILDTESTGPGKRAEVVEIAIVDTTGATRFHALVMPMSPISSGASDVHGLTRPKLREFGARPWPEIHDRVCEVLDSAAVVTGWNIEFDIRILEQTAERYALGLPHVDTFDMLDFCRRTKRRRCNSLGVAMKNEGLTLEGRSHRAESQGRSVLAIMNKIASDRVFS